MAEELTPQARAARVVHLLMTSGPMTALEISQAVGYRGRFSVYDMLENVAIGCPLFYDDASGRYAILTTDKK